MNFIEMNKLIYNYFFSKRKGIIGLLILLTSFLTIMNLLLPLFFSKIIDSIIYADNLENTIRYSFLYFLAFLIHNIMLYVNNEIRFKVGNRLDFELSMSFVNNLLKKDIIKINRWGMGEIQHRLLSEIDNIKILYLNYYSSIWIQGMTLLLCIIVLLNVNVYVFWMIIIVAPLILWISGLFSRYNKEMQNVINILNCKLANCIAELIRGIFTIKAYDLGCYWGRKIVDGYDKIITTSERINTSVNIYNQILNWIMFIPQMAFLILGGEQVRNDVITVGTFVLVNTYISKIFGPILTVSKLKVSIQKSINALERYLEVVTDFDIKSSENSGRRAEVELSSININNIFFDYDGRNEVFTNFKYAFQKGIYLIKGKNGCGKTTLLNIIYGLLNPTKGAVLLNNNLTMEDYRKNYANEIVYISQESILFSNLSIYENIVLDRDIKKEDVYELECGLRIMNKFQEFDDGIDTIIQENACNMSAGQKQKIILMRALVNNPKVILIDEGFSNIDGTALNNIFDFLREKSKEKIIIIVSHNKELDKFCDTIIFLESKGGNDGGYKV